VLCLWLGWLLGCVGCCCWFLINTMESAYVTSSSASTHIWRTLGLGVGVDITESGSYAEIS
jgi:hypothetical protein